METETNVDEPEVEGEERRALRLLLGGRMLRSRKLRRLALAYLLREGDEGEDDDTEEDEGGGEERRVLRMLLGGRMLRRRRLRRLGLAHCCAKGAKETRARKTTWKRTRAAAKSVERCACCSAAG